MSDDQIREISHPPLLKKSLDAPDVREAQNASSNQLDMIRRTNSSSSDGSATPRSIGTEHRENLVQQEQSIEIIDQTKGLVASRANMLNESDFLKEQSQTIEELAEGAKTSPVLETVKALRQWAESLPPGEQKEFFKNLSREQAFEFGQNKDTKIENGHSQRDGESHEGKRSDFKIGEHNYPANSVIALDPTNKIAQQYTVEFSIKHNQQESELQAHRINDGKNARTNEEFLEMFLTGSGNDRQMHDTPGDKMLEAFKKSPGADSIRKQYSDLGFPPFTDKLGYGTFKAFEDTILPRVTSAELKLPDYSNPGVHVGGFGNPPKKYQPWALCTATRCNELGEANKNGAYVQFQVVNLAGANSWFLHIPFIKDKPVGQSGPYRTIVEIFRWTEPLRNRDKAK